VEKVKNHLEKAFRQTQKRYAGAALALAMAGSLGLQAAGWPAAGGGLILGSLAGAMNFVLMGEALRHRLAPASRPGRGAVLWRLTRFLVLATPLVLAGSLPVLNLPATAAGLFLVPLCILADRARVPWGGQRPPGS
jgi:hypothetical protein